METTPNTTPTSETPNGTAPIQGETPTHQGTGETPGTTTELSPAEIRKENERLAAALKRANAEAKEHREARQELQKFKEQAENEKLSEKERLEKLLAKEQKERADFVLRTQERLVNSELRAQAARLGFADPADAVAMLSRTELEFDEDGIPTNAAELLQAMLKVKPYLAGKPAQTAPTAGGATAPERSRSNNQAVTQEYINSLTPQEWRDLTPQRKQEIAVFQAQNSYRFGQRH